MVYEVANGVLIYYLPEELDHYAADMLKRKTAHVFDEEEIRYLIFDFSKTQFMDSSGIGLITGRFGWCMTREDVYMRCMSMKRSIAFC